MMFSKYIVVVSGDIDIRDYGKLLKRVLDNTDFRSDLVFTKGPLDVLDHASDTFSFGGKLAIDATEKLPEELSARKNHPGDGRTGNADLSDLSGLPAVNSINDDLLREGHGVLIIGLNPSLAPDSVADLASGPVFDRSLRLIIAVDHTVDVHDIPMVTWQLLGNSDPGRDTHFITQDVLLVDGTIKYFGKRKFSRRWPNVVCSDESTIKTVDAKWDLLNLGDFLPSPSLKYRRLLRKGKDEIES
jgi:4-hydroxy-3-polyprenylbenzoate decarboxylase